MSIDQLAGQVAMVTGANRGIGRQLSQDLASAGALVILTARDVHSLVEVSLAIRAAGGLCESVSLDVTREDQVRHVFEDAISRHGKIDLLINNAGIGNGTKYPWDMPVEDFWAVQEVNLRGVYLCSQAALRHMTKRRSGRIIDVGSMIAAKPNPGATAYAVSKTSLFRLNSCFAEAAKEFDVSIFIISPGLVATDMTKGLSFARIPADQWVPIEKSGALVVSLASGIADKLSGRFIRATDDLEKLIKHADEIIEQDLQTLEIRLFEG